MATAAGYQIKDPAELSSLGEGDIARISGSSAIYRRDLAKEQEAMKTYTGGRGTAELDQAFNKFVYMGGSTGSSGTIQAAEVSTGLATGEIKPPASTADVLKETQVANAQKFSESANTQLTIYQQQMEDAKKQAEVAQTKLDELNTRRETEVVAEYDKLSEPFRKQMEDAGNEEFQLKEKYQRYSTLASSLTTYAEQAYNDLQAEKARPGLKSLATSRYNNIADDYNTKMTLTQVAMSALSNDIALGRTFIDRGIAAVEADHTDRLNYLSFVNDIISSDYSETYSEYQLATQEEKDAISNQIAVITNELNRIEEEKDMVSEFLIGDNAYVALQAGVNLTDTYDEMVQKVANYYKQNPDQVLLNSLTSGQRAELSQAGLTFDASGNIVSQTATITSTGQTGDYGLELLDTGGAAAGNRSDRNNNPLNIKASSFTAQFKGVIGMENSAAADGGNFLVFDSPDSGFAAAQRLWREGSSYKGVSVATGLQRWSGGGYGADVANAAGIDPNRDAQSLSDTELQSLFGAMAKREGYTGVGNTYSGETSSLEGVISLEEYKSAFTAAGGIIPSEEQAEKYYKEYVRSLNNQGIGAESITDYSNTYQGYSLSDLKDLISQDSDQEKMGFLNLDPNKEYDIKQYLGLKNSGQLSSLLSGEEEASSNFSQTEKNKLENEFGSDWETATTREQQLDFLYTKNTTGSFDQFKEDLGI